MDVTVDASDLVAGNYAADIVVSSNDPDEPEVTIPVQLQVTGTPDIALSAASLDFGPVFLGDPRDLTVIISNAGTDVLNVSSLTTNHPDFAVDVSALEVAAHDSRTVTVTYTPSASGPVASALTLLTDDPDEPSLMVTLQGVGLNAPIIVVSPHSLEESLLSGQVVTRTLTIENRGDEVLTFEIQKDASWLGVAPVSATVPAAQTVDVQVTMNATGLFGGDYSAALVFSSNAPGNSEITIPVVLHVTGAPDIRVMGEPITLESVQDFSAPQARTQHIFLIQAAPADEATLEVVAEGNYWYSGYATVYADGSIVGTVREPVAYCGVMNGSFTLQAEQVAEVLGDGGVTVEVQNSDFVNPSCLTNRHTVRLTYAPVVEHLDFGALFIGAIRSLPAVIKNVGTNPLTVTSLSTSDAQYTVNASSFTLAVGESRTIAVSFAPNQSGAAPATLSVVSDDADQPNVSIALSGEGRLSPDIDPIPAEVDETILMGMTATRTVTIANVGEADLTFNIRTESPPTAAPEGAEEHRVLLLTTRDVDDSIARVLDELGAGYDLVRSLDFSGIDFSPYDVVVVALNGGSIADKDIAALAAAASSGKLLAIVGGTSDSSYSGAVDGYLLHNSGNYHWGISQTPHLVVPLPTDRLAYSLPSPYTYSNVYAAEYMLRTADPDAIVAASNGDGWPILVRKRIGLGTLVYFTTLPDSSIWTAAADYAVLRTVIQNTLGMANVPWLEYEPRSGTVPSGGSIPIQVAIDAAHLLSGDHVASIVVSSNDPDEPEIVVPVNVHVFGAPDIMVSGAPVMVESVRSYRFDGARTEHSLPIGVAPHGPGTVELIAEGNYGNTSQEATVIAEGITLGSVGHLDDICGTARGSFDLTASQLADLASDGTVGITIQNSEYVDTDDCSPNRHTVRLTYAVVIDLDFESTLIGASRTHRFVVRNTGTDVLTVTNITASSPVFTIDPPSFALQIGETRSVAVTFSPGAAGPVAATLSVISNDGDEPVVSMSMTGEGRVPGIAVTPTALSEDLATGQSVTRTLAIANLDASDVAFAVQESADWPGVVPRSGMVPAGGSVQVQVTVSAAGFTGGDYSTTIHVSNNGRSEPEVTVPVSLHVTSAPDIRVAGAPVILESEQSYNVAGARTEHTLTLSSTPSGMASLLFIAEGEYGDFWGGRATMFVEGAAVGSVGGYYGDCGSAQRTFELTAAQVAELAADGTVAIAVQNDLEVFATCYRNRHTVRLTYPSPAELLDFGTIFMGENRSIPLVVSNAGTEVLSVTEILASSPDFTVDSSSFTLGTGESRTVVVSYAPSAIGSAKASLSILSDDPDTPDYAIALSGTGGLPPDISVTPGSLSETLSTDETVTRTVRIANSKGTDLTFSVGDYVAAGGPARVAGGESRILLIGVNISHGAVQQALSALGADYDFLQTGDFTQVDFSSYDAVLVEINEIIDEADIAALASAVSSGKVLAIFGGSQYASYADGIETYLLEHTGQFNWTTPQSPHFIVEKPDDRLARDLPASYNYASAGASSYMLRITDSAATVVASNGDGWPVLIHKPIGDGTLVYFTSSSYPGYWMNTSDFAVIRTIVRNMLEMAGVPWLSVSPVSGTIPAGMTADVQVTFDAAGLFGGDYAAAIVVSSNDPDEPEVTMPVSLHVIGVPDIKVSGRIVTVESAKGFTGNGSSTEHEFPVAALPEGGGTVTLLAEGNYFQGYATILAEGYHLGSVGGGGICSAQQQSFDLSPTRLASLAADGVISFRVENEYEVDPICTTNRHTVRLTYRESSGPLNFGSVYDGSSRSVSVVVSNDGTNDLIVTKVTSSNPEFTVDATSFTLPIGWSKTVTLTFSPTAPGTAVGQVSFFSNDPNESEDVVPVAGTATIRNDVAISPASLSTTLVSGGATTRELTIENVGGSLLTFETRATADLTASNNPAARQPGIGVETQAGDAHGAVADTGHRILVLSTTSVGASIERALAELHLPYDSLYTDTFAGIDFSPYDVIVAAIHSGVVDYPDVSALYYALWRGKRVVIFGGSENDSYAGGIAYYLLSHSGEHAWHVSEAPHLIVEKPLDRLAQGLPAVYSYVDSGASSYMLRIIDPLATVIAKNGDGWPALVRKRIGVGTLVYFTGTPYDFYWNAEPDFAVLKTIVRNAVDVSGVSWISVTPESGTIAEGKRVLIQVALNAFGLPSGIYRANVAISTNDPDEPEVAIPVQLEVTAPLPSAPPTVPLRKKPAGSSQLAPPPR